MACARASAARPNASPSWIVATFSARSGSGAALRRQINRAQQSKHPDRTWHAGAGGAGGLGAGAGVCDCAGKRAQAQVQQATLYEGVRGFAVLVQRAGQRLGVVSAVQREQVSTGGNEGGKEQQR